jgi:hypothetical protein
MRYPYTLTGLVNFSWGTKEVMPGSSEKELKNQCSLQGGPWPTGNKNYERYLFVRK